ncbi:MAG TPA: uroporphyrinogen-III C-methyltransferase [Terriglobia bacterium]|nr:uroporphyrinogen-III C-methyltransferase [Terriglobia bacterium]
MKNMGMVSIVGAGPGDPDLITVKGLDRIRRADVILHDRLVAAALLEHAQPGAVIVDVGKRFGQEEALQREIHRLMIEHARAGKRVCRLQGGDPMVFGRVGEEMAALAAAGVPFELVPGVTSVTAAPAAAGIALTRRDRAHGFMVLAASRSMSFDSAEWRAAAELARAGGAVVALMGLGRLDAITGFLLESGCAGDLPAVVISRATGPNQEIRFGALATITQSAADLKTPALLLVGSVAVPPDSGSHNTL